MNNHIIRFHKNFHYNVNNTAMMIPAGKDIAVCIMNEFGEDCAFTYSNNYIRANLRVKSSLFEIVAKIKVSVFSQMQKSPSITDVLKNYLFAEQMKNPDSNLTLKSVFDILRTIPDNEITNKFGVRTKFTELVCELRKCVDLYGGETCIRSLWPEESFRDGAGG